MVGACLCDPTPGSLPTKARRSYPSDTTQTRVLESHFTEGDSDGRDSVQVYGQVFPADFHMVEKFI